MTLTLCDSADGVTLSAVDEDGVTAVFSLPCEKPLAEKPEQALETIRKQLAKMGGSDFTCAGVESALPAPYFLPVSTLNALRRGVLEALAAAREAARPRQHGGAVKNSLLFPESRLGYQGNVLNRRAEAFYRRHGVIDHRPRGGIRRGSARPQSDDQQILPQIPVRPLPENPPPPPIPPNPSSCSAPTARRLHSTSTARAAKWKSITACGKGSGKRISRL